MVLRLVGILGVLIVLFGGCGGEGDNPAGAYDRRNGRYVWYDENGNITREEIWEKGKCIEGCE